jgi:hypothetical protein
VSTKLLSKKKKILFKTVSITWDLQRKISELEYDFLECSLDFSCQLSFHSCPIFIYLFRILEQLVNNMRFTAKDVGTWYDFLKGSLDFSCQLSFHSCPIFIYIFRILEQLVNNMRFTAKNVGTWYDFLKGCLDFSCQLFHSCPIFIYLFRILEQLAHYDIQLCKETCFLP